MNAPVAKVFVVRMLPCIVNPCNYNIPDQSVVGNAKSAQCCVVQQMETKLPTKFESILSGNRIFKAKIQKLVTKDALTRSVKGDIMPTINRNTYNY